MKDSFWGVEIFPHCPVNVRNGFPSTTFYSNLNHYLYCSTFNWTKKANTQ